VAKPAIPERRFPAATIRAQIEAILRAWGMPEDALRTTAEVMVETDLAAIDSHGVAMLAMYDRMQQAGRLRLDARPRVVRESASTALVDGGAVSATRPRWQVCASRSTRPWRTTSA
jgi:LDH2 family malate/lactate/ureidoglycolate dehydrogenase